MQAYFGGLGFEVPEHVNPADAFLDIVSGTILPRSGTAINIPACWREHQIGAAAAAAVAQGQAGAAAVVSVHGGGRGSTREDVSLQDDEELLPEGQSMCKVSGTLREPAVCSGEALLHKRKWTSAGLAVALRDAHCVC